MDKLRAKLTIGAALKHLDRLEQALDGLSLQAAENALYETRRELWTLKTMVDAVDDPEERNRFRILEEEAPANLDEDVLQLLDRDWDQARTAGPG